MDFIKQVKERVDIVRVAEYYGIKLNKNGFCNCPFHNEKTPSMSVSKAKQIFYCFGCHKGGDSVTLVSMLFNITPFEAAKNINRDLGIGVELPKNSNWNNYKQEKKCKINIYNINQKNREKLEKWEKETFIILKDYLHLLMSWKELKDPENDLYVKALKEIDYINYLIEELYIEGTQEERVRYKKTQGKEIERIGKELRARNP